MGHLLAARPNEILALDFTLLEPSSTGLENVLVMTDIFTKYTLAVPTRDQRAETVAQVLVIEWFSLGCLVGSIQTKAVILSLLSFSSFVAYMELRSHALPHTTRLEMASANVLTELCTIFCAHCRFQRRGSGHSVFLRYSLPIILLLIKLRGSPLIS